MLHYHLLNYPFYPMRSALEALRDGPDLLRPSAACNGEFHNRVAFAGGSRSQQPRDADLPGPIGVQGFALSMVCCHGCACMEGLHSGLKGPQENAMLFINDACCLPSMQGHAINCSTFIQRRFRGNTSGARQQLILIRGHRDGHSLTLLAAYKKRPGPHRERQHH